MPNFLPAIVRTVVPYLVGWLISLPLVVHLEDALGLSQDQRGPAVARLLTILIGAIYYVIVHYLEQHQAAFGWLLGIAKQPAYPVQVGAHVAATGGHPDTSGDAEDALRLVGGGAIDDAGAADAGFVLLVLEIALCVVAIVALVIWIHTHWKA